MTTPLPTNYTLRPATWDDFAQVLTIVGERTTVDFGEPMREHRLRERWESIDLARAAWVILAPDGSLAAYSDVHGGDGQYHPMFYVTADELIPTLGAILLHKAEQQALVLAGQDADLRLVNSVSGSNRAARQVFESAGYTTNLSFIIMEILMDAPPPTPQWPDGIHVRGFVPGKDEQATYQADEEASQDKGYHRPMAFDAWARRMNLNGMGFDAGLWHLACEGDTVVGVALNAYSQETNTGWIDHLGVRRAWRKRGLGQALLLHSFGVFYKRGVRRVKLSVDSGSLTNAPRLYERVGMKTIQQYHIYEKRYPDR